MHCIWDAWKDSQRALATVSDAETAYSDCRHKCTNVCVSMRRHRLPVMQQSLGRVNDHSVYRDLIATQKPAHILRLSAASRQPGVNILLPETLPFFSSCTTPCCSLLPLLPAPLPFSTNLFICNPLPPFLSLCALISLGTQQQEETCLLKKEKKQKPMHTWLCIYSHTNT